jgi:hypothetical protein
MGRSCFAPRIADTARAISNVILLSPALNVIGEERFSMWNSFLMLAVLVPSFYIGSHWGTAGIAAVWVFVYPLLALPLFWAPLPEDQYVSRRIYCLSLARYQRLHPDGIGSRTF